MKTAPLRQPFSRQLLTAFRSLFFASALVASVAFPAHTQDRLTIAANGGGSGPLADTLAAVAMTGLSEVDFVELNLAVTGDDQLIVFPQPRLDGLTNVSELFPERAREDGSYHIADFTLQEIRQLRRTSAAHNAAIDSGSPAPPSLGIASLEETLALLRSIEQQEAKRIGIAPNLNFVGDYKKEGKDVSRLLIATLADFGYSGEEPVMVQSGDGDELQRIKEELLPLYGLTIPLVQRVSTAAGISQPDNSFTADLDHSWVFTRLGLRMVSSYADALILPGSYVHKGQPSPLPPGFIDDARTLGLDMFVTTNSASPGALPEFAASYDQLLDYYYTELGLDGVLTADSAQTLDYLVRLATQEEEELKKVQLAEQQAFPLSVYLQRQAIEKEEAAVQATTKL